MIDLIIWPLLAAFVLTGIHVYLGLHVVTRGVIFVDLALAQVAALGAAIGIIMGLDHDEHLSYILALSFTFIGAAFFAYVRSNAQKIPQEAIIGITYVVSAAAMILFFSKSAEGAEHLNHLLVGSILFVMPEKVGFTALLYSIIGWIHWKYRHAFFQASQSHVDSGKIEKTTRYWDFLFYVTFGFVVTSSVKIAGVLLVFSFLIIPTVAALLFKQSVKSRLIFGWIFGMVGSFLGMFISIGFDVPTGASIVVTFGSLLALLGVVKCIKD